MATDDNEQQRTPNSGPSPSTVTSRTRDFFSIPAPIKHLFDRFPVITYEANDLPCRSPSNSPNFDTSLPIGSNKILKYASEHGSVPSESADMRYDAYMSLLDHRIRSAWVNHTIPEIEKNCLHLQKNLQLGAVIGRFC